MLIAIIIICWLGFAIATMGGFFADLQDEYPTIAKSCRRIDMFISIMISLLFGPVIFFIFLLNTKFKHGWRLK